MTYSFDTVAVIGLGYIGLPTATVLATHGHRVIGVDVNPRHVDAVNAGTIPFVEDGLEVAVEKAVTDGNLSAQAETPHADAYIVAVPTPFQGDHEADLTYIMDATAKIAPQLVGGELVILESTSPPLATEKMKDKVLELRPDLTAEPGQENSVYFAHAPERVLPGRIMIEMKSNDRIVGGTTDRATDMAHDLYATFCEGQVLKTDATTAEMAKLVENSFRDVNIAFANELSLIADKLNIDVWELIELANHHPRVNILQPGPGVGGHCIAVDPWFIVSSDRQNSRLITMARLVNDDKPNWVMDKVEQALAGKTNPTIAALGIAFKPDIDDLRASPSKQLALDLADKHTDGRVLVVEPNVDTLPKEFDGKGNVALTGLDDAVQAADVVLLLVDHTPFKEYDTTKLKGKQIVDTKGIWNR